MIEQTDFMTAARQSAIETAKRWMEAGPLFIDTETTGLDNAAQVCDIAVVNAAGEIILNTLVKPTCPISPSAQGIHKITDEMVKDAPTWQDLWPFLRAVFNGHTVITYNAAYDIRLIRQSVIASGLGPDQWDLYRQQWQPKCAMLMYAEYFGDWNQRYYSFRWQSLDHAARQCGIEWQGSAHRALADTLMACKITQYVASKA